MKKFIRILVVILLLLGAATYYFLQPAGDLENYKSYFPVTERQAAANEISVTFFGNTCLLFDDGTSKILIDPFLSRPTKWNTLTGEIGIDSILVKGVAEKYLHGLNGIFVSHSHFDHILDLPLITDMTKAKVYGSLSTLNYTAVNTENASTVEYDHEKGHKIGTFHVLPIRSMHSEPNIFNNDLNQVFTSNKKLPYKLADFKEGGSFDFLITHGAKKFLVKASFNSEEGQYVNQKVDVAFLGITGLGKANQKTTDQYFTNLVSQISPNIIIPIHWDDFMHPLMYSLKPIFRLGDDIPKAFNKLIEREKEINYQFLLMNAYQVRVF